MNKPVYRHLADKKWRSYDRKVLDQRLTQLHVIPDVLPTIDPNVQVKLRFGKKKAHPGDCLPSNVTEHAPVIDMQVFNAGQRLVTIVIVDSDVPNIETDNFDHRCNGLYTNIPVAPTAGVIDLGKIQDEKTGVVLPWLPPHCQKGAPWHRLSVWILEQKDGAALDSEAVRKGVSRLGVFSLRDFVREKALKPVGVTLFRSAWDEWTAEIMGQHGIPGAGVEYKKAPIDPMPYKKKDGARYR